MGFHYLHAQQIVCINILDKAKVEFQLLLSRTCTLFDMFLFVMNFLIHEAFLYIVLILKLQIFDI